MAHSGPAPQAGTSKTGSVKPAKQPAAMSASSASGAGRLPNQSPSRANQGAPGPDRAWLNARGPQDRHELTVTQPRAPGISPRTDVLIRPEPDVTAAGNRAADPGSVRPAGDASTGPGRA